MLLPQSSAFAALKNRLNSVSSIGYLHIAPRPYVNSATGNGVSGGGAHLSHSRHGSVAEAFAGSPSSPPLASPNRKCTSGIDAHMLLTRSTATTPSASTFDRPNRLKGRDDSIIRWNELLEKFRSVQERARRLQRGDEDDASSALSDLKIGGGDTAMDAKGTGREGTGGRAPPVPAKDLPAAAPPAKTRTLGRPFGRLGGAVAGRGKRAQQ